MFKGEGPVPCSWNIEKKEKEKIKKLQPKFVGCSSGPDTVTLLAKSYLILGPK